MNKVQLISTEMSCRLQSVETEELALGFIIGHDKKYQDELFLELTKDDFSVYEYQVLFMMMQEMYQKQKVINIQTVNGEKKSFGYTKPSGADIMEFILKANHSSLIQGTIEVLKQCTLNRAFVSKIQQASKDWQNGADTEEVSQKLMTDLGNILLRTKTEEMFSFSQVSEKIDSIIQQNRRDGIVRGVLFMQIPELDKNIGGFSNGDLCVIGAESGAGKSALGLTIATMFSKRGICGAYYSAEMEVEQLASRIYSAEINDNTIYSSSLRKSVLNNRQYELFLEQKEKIGNMPLYFDENNNMDIDAICKSIRVMKKRFNIQYAFVDYLQMLFVNEKNNKLNNELFLGMSVRKLKNLAKEEKIVIFLLSQLSRDVNKVGLHPSRFRGSGQIMETATQAIMMERGTTDEGNPHFKEEGYTNVSSKNKALLRVVKNREGVVGNYIILGYDAPHTRFYSERESTEIEETPKEVIPTNASSYKLSANQVFEIQANQIGDNPF
jgi:replicative DNA helicase